MPESNETGLSLAFVPVPRKTPSPRADSIPADYLKNISEAWEYAKAHPETDLSVTMPSENVLKTFVRLARKYGQTEDGNFIFRQLSVDEDTLTLTFRMVDRPSYEAALAERKRKAEEREQRRAAAEARGETLKPGRKAAD
jgi:hypothetical protein